MNSHRWMFYGLSFLLLIVAGVLFLGAVGLAVRDYIDKSAAAYERPLIERSDHKAILQACQKVLLDPEAAGFPKGSNFIVGSQNGFPSPPTALPGVLRDLQFSSMVLRDQHAEIWFGGGFGHWGFTTAPIWNDPGGVVLGANHVELTPGLWFWSEYALPRDTSKNPYYAASIVLLVVGVAVMIGAIALAVRTWRRKAA